MKTLLLVLLLVGCERSRTEIMIGVATDLRAPGQLDGVDMVVTRVSDNFEYYDGWDITGKREADYNLPGSYALISDGEEVRFKVELVGKRGATEVVKRTAILNLVEGKTLFFRMGLTTGCAEDLQCPGSQVCVEGSCSAVDVESDRLPDFDPILVDTVTCRSTITYLDTATGMPMATAPGAEDCPPDRCHEGTCYKPPPGTPNTPDGGINGPDAAIPGVDALGVDASNACDVLSQTGCTGGDRCTWIIDGSPDGGYIGCAPVGTVALGGACTYGPAGPTGYDDCVAGAVCGSGECKQICDPQGGGTSCATNFSCGRYESLLQSGGTAVGGVCDHDCNPLNQTRVAGAVPACGSPTPANPTKGCYNSDGYVQFTCGPANSDVLSRTDDALPKLNGSGTAYPNGCAPGYQALVYESATTMTVKCTGLCAPRDVDSAKAGADATYGAGDPTKTAKLVTGSSPAVGNAVCKTGKKGSTQGGQGNGSTQNCLHMWPFLATGGAPSSSQYNDTLGLCFNFGEWTWDHDRNAGTPEVTRPSCTAVAPAGSQADDAAYLGCYSLATTQGLPGARSSIVTAQQEMRVGYGPAQLVRHRYR